jgi:hypothetical protein
LRVKLFGYSVSVQIKQNLYAKKVYGFASLHRKTLNSILAITEDAGHTRYPSHGKAHSPQTAQFHVTETQNGAEAV